MRVLFSSTWGYGHVFPMVPLARAFAAAGHDVLWATNEPACALVTAAGLPAAAVGLDTAGVAAVVARAREETRDMPGADRAAFLFPNMFGSWAAEPMAADLLPLARHWRPDLIINEHGEVAAPLVSAVLGVPSFTHAFGGAIPVDFLTAAGTFLAPLWAAQGLEIPPYAGLFETGYLDICPASVQGQPVGHITGRLPLRPVVYTGEPNGVPLPDRDPNRPQVYVTLGTVNNRAPVLAELLDGLATLEADVLVTVGPDGDPAALVAQPAHVAVRRWVCQSEVLAQCDTVVSHAGSGTFLGALAEGLPQLAVPQAADQFRNARAGVERGAALALLPGETEPTAISTALQRLLADHGFRAAAGEVAAEIAAMPAPADVVRALEASI
ncbi:MAG: glycosyltransferase [Actinomycetota bacterium]